MKIRGLLAGQFSGSLAGVTASHNRGGYYLRNRSGPVNVNSQDQLRARENFAASVAGWGALDSLERTDWSDAAANQPWTDNFGDAITLTGQMWFIGVNSALRTAGLAAVTAPPTPGERPSLSVPVSMAIETSLTTQEIGVVYGAVPGAAGDRVLLYFSGPLGPGVDTPPNRWRLLGAIAANNASIVIAAYPATWQAGDRIALMDQIVRADGQYSSRRPIGIVEVESAP